MLQFTLRSLAIAGATFWLSQGQAAAQARSLADYAAEHRLELFECTRGAVMTNRTDQTNNLAEGDRALLLSSLELTDIRGISRLTVVDDGRPVPIGSAPRLHVFLNNNQIAEIPDEIADLDNVVFLYFNDNRLRALPEALADMESLEGMYYSSNRFTEIPAFVFDMTRLKKLQFSHNEIRLLPPEIGNLVELRHFNMADNRIAVIPDTIARLTKLRVCDLSDNRIRELPEVFGEVRIVNQLRVRNNPLSALPRSFSEMRATIDITGTQIDLASLPPELQVKIRVDKPPGSKIEADIIVRQPPKDD